MKGDRNCREFNGSQLAKMKKKKNIPTCHCHKISRVEAVGLKIKSRYKFKQFH